VRLVKILENSVDYSVMNTTRQAIFLPLDKAEKYEAKITIDTFFWRLGDMIQAGAFFVGLHYLGMTIVEFALFNMALALAWVAVAVLVGRRYVELLSSNVANAAPELMRQIPDAYAPAGSDLSHRLDHDQFIDKDPGDLLSYSATLVSGAALPSWITFSSHTQTFSGRAPDEAEGHVEIEVVATDTDNLTASGSFFLFFAARS
jgi:AAA family ATP:ADP antiporter